MMRPGVTLALWVAIAVLVLANNLIGDTWIADRLPALGVEWYKVLVPLPYVAMVALIHARRTTGPSWLPAALLAALMWPTSMVLVDLLYARWTYANDPTAFFDRFAVTWGAPYPLLVLVLFIAPLLAGSLMARRGL